MNILYIALDLNISEGNGGATHALETITSLTHLGHTVFVLQKRNKENKFFERNGNLFLYNLPIVFNPGVLKQLNLIFCNVIASIYLLLFKKIDVVWERARIFGGLSLSLGKKFGKKTIFEMNEPLMSVLATSEIKKNTLKFKIIRKIFFNATNNADLITVTHKSMINDLPERNKKKALMIWYGADVKKFKPATVSEKKRQKLGLPSGKLVLYSGSFQDWHALKETISAAELCVKKMPDIKFVLVGSGKLFDEINDLVKKKGLEKNVLLLGKKPLDLMPVYVNASVVCLALFKRDHPPIKKFDYYFSPIKVHEYKACGKPVVASNIGNLNELVKDGVNGLTVDERKPKEIADAILHILSNGELQKKMKANNLIEAKTKYNWIKITEKILKKLSN